jgi:thiamine-phosphate pyrophosphorylase
MKLPKLHFITQPSARYSNAELVEQACLSGVRLVQLRIKDQPIDFIFEEAKAVREVCLKYKATLILNDHVEIAKELNVDGVHLGKSDLSPIKARAILGENSIMGGTANNLEDITSLIAAKVDYIGLGPYQFTTTKKKLSPILGVKGYQTILSELKGVDFPPIYAIGGILREDIPSILKTGVHGVALSGLIANSKDIHKEVMLINELLQSSIE